MFLSKRQLAPRWQLWIPRGSLIGGATQPIRRLVVAERLNDLVSVLKENSQKRRGLAFLLRSIPQP
jgi:hypothetical protein